MSGQSEAYRRRELLRHLEGLRSTESAKAAEWLESLKSHPGYQALTQDPEWVRMSAEWQRIIEQDEQDRAIFKGRFLEDLTDAEKARCAELNGALHERLFPLKSPLMKLLGDYKIPSRPVEESKILARLKNSELGNFLDDAGTPLAAARHLWAVRFPLIPFSSDALYCWLARLGISRYQADAMPIDELCALLRNDAHHETVNPPAATPKQSEGAAAADVTPEQDNAEVTHSEEDESIELDGTGELIVDTLGKNAIDVPHKRWKGDKIARTAKATFNSHFKSTLAHLRQMKVLANPGRGYYLDTKGQRLYQQRQKDRQKVRTKSGSK